MKKLTLGEFTMHQTYQIPVIEVLLDGEVAGYLSPFRGYHFQISQTYDGHLDLGSSINTGSKLENYFLFSKSDTFDVFKALATTALHDFCRSYKVREKCDDEIVIDVNLKSLYGTQDNFNEFIKASVDWIDKIRFEW